jgi:fibronectin type 3 domain-containing protein
VFRKYVYDPNNVPQNPFGDLQPPVGTVAMKDGRLTDTAGALALSVYTMAYDDEPPAAVRGLKVETVEGGPRRLSWQANEAKDLCYYRVYRGEKADFTPDLKTQIGSTIATQFTDAAPGGAAAGPGKEYHYKVLAVDSSGNASRP